MLMYGCSHRFELDIFGVVVPWISALRVRRTQVVDQADLQEAMEGMLRVRAGATCTPARSVQKSRRRICQKDGFRGDEGDDGEPAAAEGGPAEQPDGRRA